MYWKKFGGMFKHYDFILLDMLCLQLAFVLAYAARGLGLNPYAEMTYRHMAIFLELADIVVIFMYGTVNGVLKRGRYVEFTVTVKHALIICLSSVFYMFLLQEIQQYSRLTFILTIIFYIVITYAVRLLRKRHLKRKMKNGGNSSLLIVTTKSMAESVIKNIRNNNYAMYTITGLAIIDRHMVGETIADVEVVADIDNAPEYVCQEWIDEVMVVPEDKTPKINELIDKLIETGVTVHENIANMINSSGEKQFIEKVGNYTVLTTSINYATSRQLILKRLMDIIVGLIGCIFTAIIFIFVAPAIYISSPGPIFFAQERVGKNGKRFKMYKFRSMYLDAEERKAELMEQNKISDSKMFKLDFDPRVIGNKILPDGTKKTGVGHFIRSTSLDEFPQFFNVLKGDMSVVGTRPPLPGEVSEYELHHRARLAVKPGITGLWQVSGRSNITDFEEVVRLDKEYISNWNLGLDLKIIFKTFGVVLKEDGSM